MILHFCRAKEFFCWGLNFSVLPTNNRGWIINFSYNHGWIIYSSNLDKHHLTYCTLVSRSTNRWDFVAGCRTSLPIWLPCGFIYAGTFIILPFINIPLFFLPYNVYSFGGITFKNGRTHWHTWSHEHHFRRDNIEPLNMTRMKYSAILYGNLNVGFFQSKQCVWVYQYYQPFITRTILTILPFIW